MSWSVSASGKRAEVKQRIDQQVNPANASADMKVEFERARAGLHSLVDSTTSTHVSVTGNGSASGPVSLSVSCWNEQGGPTTG